MLCFSTASLHLLYHIIFTSATGIFSCSALQQIQVITFINMHHTDLILKSTEPIDAIYVLDERLLISHPVRYQQLQVKLSC